MLMRRGLSCSEVQLGEQPQAWHDCKLRAQSGEPHAAGMGDMVLTCAFLCQCSISGLMGTFGVPSVSQRFWCLLFNNHRQLLINEEPLAFIMPTITNHHSSYSLRPHHEPSSMPSAFQALYQLGFHLQSTRVSVLFCKGRSRAVQFHLYDFPHCVVHCPLQVSGQLVAH